MDNSNSYWLPSNHVIGGIQNTNHQLKNKEGEMAISQPTMVNFANIFAGASAAVASSATANSEILGNVDKAYMVGQNMSTLGSIPPASQLSKRSGVFPVSGSLPGLATINNIGINSISSAAMNNNNLANIPRHVTAVPSTFTSSRGNIHQAVSLTYTTSTGKDFIQQAAAESGMIETNLSTLPLTDSNYAIQQQQQQVTTPSARLSLQQANIIELSPNSSNYKCGECNKAFKDIGQLQYHTFVTHSQLKPHKCNLCPQSFVEAHHLQEHIQSVHPQPANPPTQIFTCTECQESFNSGHQLSYHINMVHASHGRNNSHACELCGKVFIKPSLLSSHIKNVHQSPSLENSPLLLADQILKPNVNGNDPRITNDFACVECNKSFKSGLHLKQHHHAIHNKPHKCEECGKGFGRRSDLNRHTRGVHMRERPHSCLKCGWTFAEAGNLKHHIQAVHSKEKNYRCHICSRSFAIPSYLKTHMLRVHSMSDFKPVSSNNNDNIVNTMLTAMSDNIQQQQTFTHVQQQQQVVPVAQSQVNRCFECGQMFPNPAMLQNHVMSTHPQPFWCTVCGEGFSQAFQLQTHLQARHSDPNNNNLLIPQQSQPTNNNQQQNTLHDNAANPGQMQGVTGGQQMPGVNGAQMTGVNGGQIVAINSGQMEKCEGCGVVITKNSKPHLCPGLKFQQAALTAVAAIAMAGERPHMCTKCGKGFKTATHLKQHVRCVHTKDRPHMCKSCPKTFARMSDLNRHVKGVHEKSKTVSKQFKMMSLKCTECGSSFNETSHLKRHILTVHLHQQPCFKCADCQEGFPDEISFKSHICHERERPNVCPVCSKRFPEISQLRRHTRSAHTSRGGIPRTQHKCFECRRSFTRPVDLERHIHAVHLKEKPHKCTICSKSFGLFGNLNKHVRAVHMLEKPHQCVECGKCFAHIGVLKRHLRDIHFYDKRPRKQKSNLIREHGTLMIENIHENSIIQQPLQVESNPNH